MADWAGTIEGAPDGRLAGLYRGLRAALRAEPATAALATVGAALLLRRRSR